MYSQIHCKKNSKIFTAKFIVKKFENILNPKKCRMKRLETFHAYIWHWDVSETSQRRLRDVSCMHLALRRLWDVSETSQRRLMHAFGIETSLRRLETSRDVSNHVLRRLETSHETSRDVSPNIVWCHATMPCHHAMPPCHGMPTWHAGMAWHACQTYIRRCLLQICTK